MAFQMENKSSKGEKCNHNAALFLPFYGDFLEGFLYMNYFGRNIYVERCHVKYHNKYLFNVIRTQYKKTNHYNTLSVLCLYLHTKLIANKKLLRK